MAKITFVVAGITFKVVVITSSVAKINFEVGEITFIVAVIKSSVDKINFCVATITFVVTGITFKSGCDHFFCDQDQF